MVAPHGGVLQDLIARDSGKKKQLLAEAATLPSLVLSDRQVCDLELILNGGFSPLTGFNNQKDYEGIKHNLRLADGTIWPIPIALDVFEETAKTLKAGDRIVLRDPRDDAALAIITVEDVYKVDKEDEIKHVFRGEPDHVAARYLVDVAGDYYVGGEVDAIALPVHYDYVDIRRTPAQLRADFEAKNWNKVVAFQTRNPMHRAHRELTVRAAREQLANVLIHPVVGMTKAGDIDHHTRVKVYKEIIKKYPNGMAELSLLPIAMRMAGDREAVWHGIIRKNYGSTHFIVGRSHACQGAVRRRFLEKVPADANSESNSDSEKLVEVYRDADIYGPYDAQELFIKYEKELGIKMVPFKMVTYLPDEDRYSPIDAVPAGTKTASISGTQLRKALKEGTDIPDWFSYNEVVKILRTAHPPRPLQGFAIYLNGLKHSGIRAFSYALQSTFNQFDGGRNITLIDDNSLDRSALPFVVPELVRSGAGVIIANSKDIPSAEQFSKLKAATAKAGSFLTVNIETPLESIKAKDRDSYYETEAGKAALANFAPFKDAEFTVDLSTQSGINVAIQKIVLFLEDQGFYKF